LFSIVAIPIAIHDCHGTSASLPMRIPDKKAARLRLAAGVAVGLALAAIYWFRFPTPSDPLFGYAQSFLDIASSIEKTGAYTHQLADGRVVPETLREPFYPCALAAAIDLLGWPTRLVPFQEAAAVAVFLTWVFVTWRVLGLIWAMGMAVLIFFNPPLFFYPAILYPYAFNVFFLSTALLSLWMLLARKKVRWAVAAGLAFGLAAYERGSLLLLPFLLAFCLFWMRSLVSRRAVLAVTLTYAACVSPWLLRNASYGIIGMQGMMGQALGYTYGNIILAESDLTRASPDPDPFGLRASYVEVIRREGPDDAAWKFIETQENAGRSLAWINRALAYYVMQAVSRQPAAAGRVVLTNLELFPSRLVQLRVDHEDTWGFYSLNDYSRSLTWGDELVLVGCACGLAMMLLNREPILAVILPVMFYLVAINVPLIVSDPRYRNGLFDIFAFFSLLYALRFLWFWARRGDWRQARLGLDLS
jgi:hypothetical protein